MTGNNLREIERSIGSMNARIENLMKSQDQLSTEVKLVLAYVNESKGAEKADDKMLKRSFYTSITAFLMGIGALAQGFFSSSHVAAAEQISEHIK